MRKADIYAFEYVVKSLLDNRSIWDFDGELKEYYDNLPAEVKDHATQNEFENRCNEFEENIVDIGVQQQWDILNGRKEINDLEDTYKKACAIFEKATGEELIEPNKVMEQFKWRYPQLNEKFEKRMQKPLYKGGDKLVKEYYKKYPHKLAS